MDQKNKIVALCAGVVASVALFAVAVSMHVIDVSTLAALKLRGLDDLQNTIGMMVLPARRAR